MFADAYFLSPDACNDALLQKMKRHFSVAEIIELTFVATWLMGQQKINALFDFDPAEKSA